MRDLLVRYLLGELNLQEQEQLEAQLRDSPDLRRELEYLRACMAAGREGEPAERNEAAGTPSGLAERTLGRICGDEPGRRPIRSPAEVTAAYDAPANNPSWSLADITVAGGVFLAISMLFLPALRQSRDAARRNGCANNLHEIGTMLIRYANVHDGIFPTPARHQNAGIYAVYLLDEHYATSDELARFLVCRASPLAEDIAQKRVVFRVPTMVEFEAASAHQRCVWKRIMGGSYAYRIGYIEDGHYCPIHNDGSSRKAMLADAPCKRLKYLQSDHHGGENVFFQDGHVAFQSQPTLPEVENDRIYLNNAGQEAAGLGRDDTVLGRSEIEP